jgi:hypothetical protein
MSRARRAASVRPIGRGVWLLAGSLTALGRLKGNGCATDGNRVE